MKKRGDHLFINITFRNMALKMSKLADFSYFLLMTAKYQSQFCLSASRRYYLVLSENAVDYWAELSLAT